MRFPPSKTQSDRASRFGLGLAVACLLASGCSPPTLPPAEPTPSRTAVLLGPTSTPSATTSPAAPASTSTATPRPVPTVSSADHRLGPPGAPVRILVYSDFQSNTAAQGLRVLFQVVDLHPEEVELAFRHYPVVAEFDKDSIAGQAVEAAGRQDLFWEMARLLVDRHAEWSVLPPESFRSWLYEQSSGLGLEPTAFRQDIDGGRYTAYLADAFHQATSAGIPGLPTIFLNGVVLRFSPTALNLESAVRLEILGTRQFPEEPPLTLEPQAGYTVTLETGAGEVVLQLLPDSAPRAVNSFIFLADQGWFDRTNFYRVEPRRLVEMGDPSSTGFGDPGYHLPDELDSGLDFNQPGMVALSSAGPGTGGSRLIITLRPFPEWNGTRTIFGRVIEGLEILEGLPARDPAVDLLAPDPIVIRRVRIAVTR